MSKEVKQFLKHFILSVLVYTVVIISGGLLLSAIKLSINDFVYVVIELTTTILAFVAFGFTYGKLARNNIIGEMNYVSFFKFMIVILTYIGLYYVLALVIDGDSVAIIYALATFLIFNIVIKIYSRVDGKISRKLSKIIHFFYISILFVPVYFVTSVMFQYARFSRIDEIATAKYELDTPSMLFVDLILFSIVLYYIQYINYRNRNKGNEKEADAFKVY